MQTGKNMTCVDVAVVSVRRTRHRVCGLVVLLAVSLWAAVAHAGDQEPVFFGGEAGMSAGAISAIT